MFKAVLFGVLVLVPAMAQASSVGWSEAGVVTMSSGRVTVPDRGAVSDYPAKGRAVVINSYLEFADPDDALDPGFSGFLPLWMSASFYRDNGDFFEASFGTAGDGVWVDSISLSSGSVSFNSGDIHVHDGIAKAEETLYGAFGFTFSPALTTAPATWGDLLSAWNADQLFASLSFSGTANYEPVVFAAGEDLPQPAPVPLPASALFLVAGLCGVMGFRRRRSALSS